MSSQLAAKALLLEFVFELRTNVKPIHRSFLKLLRRAKETIYIYIYV
jgi:hypothetical protein